MFDNRYIYYFEVRDLKDSYKMTKAHSGNQLILNGWVSRDKDNVLKILKTRTRSGYIPFSILFIESKHYIIVQRNGYEGESYIVMEVIDNALNDILVVHGGGC